MLAQPPRLFKPRKHERVVSAFNCVLFLACQLASRTGSGIDYVHVLCFGEGAVECSEGGRFTCVTVVCSPVLQEWGPARFEAEQDAEALKLTAEGAAEEGAVDLRRTVTKR